MADAISIQELIDARTDAKTLEEAVNGDAVTTVLSRLGESYPTLANALSQIDGKLDSADAQIKQAITDLFQNGGLPATPFATKALMTASPLVDGDYAMVTNDTANNGLYVKTAGAWVKSEYDPLVQAKSYTDTAKTEAIAVSKDYADTKGVDLDYYYTGNLVNADNQVRPATVMASSYNIVASATSSMSGFAVKAGDTLYLSNTVNNFSVAAAYGYAFYTNANLTTVVKAEQIAVTPVEIRNADGLIVYHKVVVPVGAKIIAFNTKFNDTPITWNIQLDVMSNNYSSGIPLVSAISGKPLKVYEPNYKAVKDGNLFDKTKDIRNGYFLKAGSTVFPATDPSIVASATSTIALFDITKNAKYYAKIIAPAEYPVLFLASELTRDELVNKANPAVGFGLLYTASYKLVDAVNSIYEVTIPSGIANPKTLLTNVILVAGSYDFNIIDTFELYQGWVNDSNAQLTAYKDLNGVGLIDTQARRELQKLSSSLLKPNGGAYLSHHMKGKRVFTFGDSITMGTMGGYVKYYESELQMVVNNYGVSGDTTASLRKVMLGLDGKPILDYTQADVVTIMIGTNNRTSNATYWSSLDGIPTDTVYDHVADSTTTAYFASFPATFAGDVSACIEYVKWKNPKAKIYLVSPPTASLYTAEMLDRVQYYKRLADTYSLTFVNGTQSCGLSIKDIGVWSYDGLHFNELGNEVFGKFMAKNIAFR